MISKTRDTSKYCEFHQDYGHDTNVCIELKSQIEEAVKSRKLAHLIKGIRKAKAKQTNTQLGKWIAPTVKAEPATKGKDEPILMIGMVNNPLKRKEPPKIMSIEEMIFLPIRNRAPFLRKEIREKMRDVYTALSGFSDEQVNPLGEISLLINVGEAMHHRSEQITFLIVRSDSPQQHAFWKDDNRRIRDDPLYDALRSTVSVGSWTDGHYVIIPRCKNMLVPGANGDHRKTTPYKGQTRADHAAQRQCRRIRLAILGHDRNPSNTKNKRNKLCH
ncbi:hypothetical protein Tco_1242252 [Tanacetum coccineum]